MKVVFRVDASIAIGTGHVMRCLTLADAIRSHGGSCEFVCRRHEGNLIEYVRSRGYCVRELPFVGSFPIRQTGNQLTVKRDVQWLGCSWRLEAEQTLAVLVEGNFDWIVIDHYGIGAPTEQILLRACRKLMVIDDLADRNHNCHLLLDQNLGRVPADYLGLVPSSCRLLIGPAYALLRPEFAVNRRESLHRRRTPTLERLLVSLGGVDKDNVTQRVLEAINTDCLPDECRITVVMGRSAPWLNEVRVTAAATGWPIDVLVGVDNLAELMTASDLAIGAAGGTSWERCCMGLPTVLLILAENQVAGARALEAANAAKLLSGARRLEHELPAVLKNLQRPGALASLSKASSRVCDGQGVGRVLGLMEEMNE